MTTDDLRPEGLEEEDALLDEDDFLIQRFLDGSLDPTECRALEERLETEPELSSRLQSLEALYRVLDTSALARSALMWADDVPRDLVEGAIEQWQAERDPESVRPVFASWKQAASFFVVADAVLASLIVVLAILRGPQELLHSWAISAKDLALFVVTLSPTPQQLSIGLPAVLIVGLGGLLAMGSMMRRLAKNSRI